MTEEFNIGNTFLGSIMIEPFLKQIQIEGYSNIETANKALTDYFNWYEKEGHELDISDFEVVYL